MSDPLGNIVKAIEEYRRIESELEEELQKVRETVRKLELVLESAPNESARSINKKRKYQGIPKHVSDILSKGPMHVDDIRDHLLIVGCSIEKPSLTSLLHTYSKPPYETFEKVGKNTFGVVV